LILFTILKSMTIIFRHVLLIRYASAPHELRMDWEKFTKDYFLNRSTLVSVFLLIDASIPAKQIDLDYASWLGQNQVMVKFFSLASNLMKLYVLGLHTFNPAYTTWFDGYGIPCVEVWLTFVFLEYFCIVAATNYILAGKISCKW